MCVSLCIRDQRIKESEMKRLADSFAVFFFNITLNLLPKENQNSHSLIDYLSFIVL